MLGAELGPVLSIAEAQPNWYGASNGYANYNGNDNRVQAGEERPAEGQVEVVAEVAVGFALK